MPTNSVIERGLGGPICGGCGAVLPVTGVHEKVCLKCCPEQEFSELLDGRELEILLAAMKKSDQSAKAVMKRWLRFGQMVDHFVGKEFELVFRAKDGSEEVDPFDKGGPKLAPMPVPHDCSEHVQMINGSPRCQICGAQ
jgi:hypothetical protein